ncbi:internalin [Planoprotostelium fungivorum]|uniref:Internalin n=1 Tax=Planoprotostelium fungivorum TaxID=1890364 RepID=A0A2P6N6A1_9EUKA|nr:internalin [Planoprotostelium fungivorum]
MESLSIFVAKNKREDLFSSLRKPKKSQQTHSIQNYFTNSSFRSSAEFKGSETQTEYKNPVYGRSQNGEPTVEKAPVRTKSTIIASLQDFLSEVSQPLGTPQSESNYERKESTPTEDNSVTHTNNEEKKEEDNPVSDVKEEPKENKNVVEPKPTEAPTPTEENKQTETPPPKEEIQYVPPEEEVEESNKPETLMYIDKRLLTTAKKFQEQVVSSSRNVLSTLSTLKGDCIEETTLSLEGTLNKDTRPGEVLQLAHSGADSALSLYTVVNGCDEMLKKEQSGRISEMQEEAKNVQYDTLKLLRFFRERCTTANAHKKSMSQEMLNELTASFQKIVEEMRGLIAKSTSVVDEERKKYEQQQKKTLDSLVSCACQLRDALTQMSQAVTTADSAIFLAATPIFVANMNRLLHIDQSFKINMYWQLKKLGAEYVHACKDTINGKCSPAHYQSLLTRMTSHLHRFITSLAARHDQIQAAVRSGKLFDFSQERMQGRDSLQHALQSAVKRFTSLLGERFVLFQKEWEMQSTEEADQLQQILVQNLHWHLSNHLPSQRAQ